MIPKVIHYCWFGKNPLSEMAVKCIESWKKYCPDYEIKEWNEDNFDINCCAYVKEAYESRKWAFVTDYVRLYALYNEGGIYMDTDVELIKPIDVFLGLPAFSGFEEKTSIPTAIMGSEKHGEWMGHLMSYYDTAHFIKPDGSFDTTTNVVTITNMTVEKYKVSLNNTFQEIEGVLTLYPKDWFCPKSYDTEEITLTENTVCIHHFSSSWHSPLEKALHDKKLELIKSFGEEEGNKKYEKWLQKNKLFLHLKYNGLKKTLGKIFAKN